MPFFSMIKKLREQHLVVTLGGDGTLLHAISLFQDATTDVPPCLPIAFGSLGFLTPIKWDHYTKVLNRLLLPNTSGRDRSVSDLYEKETNASNYGSLNSNSSRKSQDGGISLTPDPKFFRLESVKTFNSISSERGVNFERLETPQETGPSLDVTTEKMIKSESTPVLVPKLRCDSILEENLFDDNQPIFVTKRTRIFAKCKKRENRSEYCQNSNSYENSSRDGSSEYLSGLDSFVNLNLESKPINTQTRSSSYKRFVLNEVLIDRGPNAGSLHLEIYINNKMIADVRGDGVILATPTGSTAYSLSAGASIVHPSTVGCIITPICPHSLSLRPLIIPPGIKIQIRAAADARILPYVSYDGSHQHRLEMEDEISIILPEKVEEHGGFVVPCICLRDPVDDFFASLSNCLHWNSNVFQQKSVS